MFPHRNYQTIDSGGGNGSGNGSGNGGGEVLVAIHKASVESTQSPTSGSLLIKVPWTEQQVGRSPC